MHNWKRLSEIFSPVTQSVSHRLIRYLVLSVGLIFFSYVLLLDAAPLTPDKTIKVVNQELKDPAWKKHWDEARNLSQQQKFAEAIQVYLEVLHEKPHIEEVKWELSKNYIAIQDYEKALVILEGLIETTPDKIDYLVSGGQVALSMSKADQAARFFGRALVLDPTGSLSEMALLGMIESLGDQGKKALTIPLMEQLFLRGVFRSEMIVELARYFSETNNFEKGAHYYRQLLTKYRVDADIRAEAATVFEKSRNLTEAAEQLEIYLKSKPDNIESRVKLAEHYYEHGKAEKALTHFLELLDRNVFREQYLLEVAHVYLYSLGRSDRALYYFEQYRKEFPDGIDVSSEISNLQLIIANDLLAIVENDGVWMLWRDLARITPNRIGIYRAMADMLEDMGRKKERDLIEVLQIINAHEPDDFKIIAKISRLYRKNMMFRDCLSFLDQVGEHHNGKAYYFLLKAQCQAGAGLDLDQIKSYAAYLKKKPADTLIRARAITLSGKLGLIDQMKAFYDKGKRGKKVAEEVSIEESYLHGLLDNGLTNEAEQFYRQFSEGEIQKDRRMRIYRDLAFLYFNQNRLFKAEQLLRQFAADHPENAYAYLLLAHYFILREDSEYADVWLSAFEKKNQLSELDLNPGQRSTLFHQKLLLDQLNGKVGIYQKASNYLSNHLKTNQIVAEDVEVLLFAAGHYLQTNRHDECIKLIKRFQQKFNGAERLQSLLFIARHEKSSKRKPIGQVDLKNLSLSQKLAISDQLMALKRYDEDKMLLTEIGAELPHSTRTKLMLADTDFATSDYQSAYKNYTQLSKTFSAESYFREQLLRIENIQGKPESIFSIFSVASDDSGRKSHIDHSGNYSMDYPEAKLMWARALWSKDKWEESLDVYGLLDTELKREIDQLIDVVQGSPELTTKISDLSKEFALLPKDEQLFINLIMSTDFISENLTNEINQISSNYYDYYRWSKIVDKEMTAKSSLKAREFYQAELDYQELFEEEADVTEEVYPDLATVYGRLGRRQEETEIIETIKEKSILYPELSEMTEKHIRRQQPFLAIDAHYREEEGRNGYKDITQKYVGMGLQIKPTIYQETGVRAGRNEYGDSLASTLAKSNYILGSYAIQFNDYIDGDFKLGFEDFDTDGKSFLIYDLSVIGYLEQRVELFAALKQEPVDDTIDSLENGIYHKNLQLGFTLDYLFGLFFGFDLSFYDYNDTNDGDRYYLWSSYRWFGDRSSLDFTYSYLNIQNELTNESFSDPSLDNFEDGLIYWSPGDYWKHRLTALYKLELWPTGRLQSGTSSFTALYGIGYEKGDFLIHEFEANILLEISHAFLVKGSFSTLVSDDYDNLSGLVSLVYRW